MKVSKKKFLKNLANYRIPALIIAISGLVLIYTTNHLTAQVTPPSSANLVAHWSLNENSGLTAADDSGNNHHGTLTNDAAWAEGKAGAGVFFDGVNDFINVPHTSTLNTAGSLTLAAWIKKAVNGTENAIISKSTQGASTYRFRAKGDTICWGHSGATKIHCTPNLGLTLNNWYHVAVVFDDAGDNVKIYVDGVQKYSSAETKSMSNSSYPVRIGQDGSTAGNYFSGSIDDLYIYNRALTVDEIISLVQLAGGGTPPPPPVDTTPPTVSIISPADGSTVSGSGVTISANASDNIGVAGVQFKLNGTNLGAEDTSAPYSANFDTTTVANGAHSLSATARDAAGNTSSANISVNVNNLPPPPPGSSAWTEMPNTIMRNVCPPNYFGGSTYAFYGKCKGVITAWNSGVYDSLRNRLIVLGGGHADYYGNEVYALNLTGTPTVERLTDPSTVFGFETNWCPYEYPDGKISSRHTYDGVEYIPSLDKLFYFGGSRANCGNMSNDTWMFDFATLQWEKKTPTGSIPLADPGTMTAYDPNTGKIFLHDRTSLYSYDPVNNSFVKLTTGVASLNSGLTAVIDPVRQKFVAVGKQKVWVYDISPGSTYAKQSITTTGGDALVNVNYPGLTYNPTTQSVVGWAGGDTVYSLNLDNNTWVPNSATGGPGAHQFNGTYGRFSYIPPLNAFVVVNSMTQNAFMFEI